MQALRADQLSGSGMVIVRSGRGRTERIALGRLLWAGPVAVAAAVAATLVARALAVAVLPPIDPGFVELAAGSVAMVTGVLCAAAVAVFSLVAWLSRRPLRTFRIVAAVALLLSWVPDLLILSEPATTAGGVIALMLLHVVAAVAVVWTLEALTARTGDA